MSTSTASAESQPVPSPPFTRSSHYPLLPFDTVFEKSTFVTGWLVQGTIDANALSAALRRVTDKWRVLAGRLEMDPQDPQSRSWLLKVPLDPLPDDYTTFFLTESTSDVPLSSYITLPLQTTSQALPQALFLHPSTPRLNADWITKRYPLTCWHVTYFPSTSAEKLPHSCIGFARSHGVFDGVGAASIMRALVAEMRGEEWDVPPLPADGAQPNPIQQVLSNKSAEGSTNLPPACYSALGFKGVLWLAGWHLRERYWRGALHRIFAIPQKSMSFLVDGVKAEVRHENPNVEVTTGDVLAAWCMKVIYKAGTAPDTVVHCSNIASFRDIITELGGQSMNHYPHNAWIPLPYPTLRVKELNSLTIPEFALALCQARHKLTIAHVLSSNHYLSNNAFSMPVHPESQETLTLSNVSASRILESDWSAIGSQGTVCSYRFSATPNNLVIGNRVYFSGRLPDGTTILDVNLSKVRMQNLAKAIEKLKLKVPVG